MRSGGRSARIVVAQHPEGGTLRLAPPLTVSAGEIDEALAILEAALTAVEADHPATTAEAH
jgi:4-aminobutyrate aminotransferase-like enzyme